MSDPIHEKVQKLYDSRAKAEADLNRYQNDVTEAVNNADRRVRVERLVTSCEEAMTKAFAKNEQLLELAKKTNDPATATADLEKWLNVTSIQNDEILRRAREYIDRCPKTDNSSQTSVKAATVKTKSSKASSSKVSKTSSQRQRDLLIAKHKREEVERQNEAALRLAKQKQELELEQLQEENRKRLAEAHLVELELQDDPSEANEEAHETLSRLSRTTDASETRRVSDWVNNSPNVPATNPETETLVTASLATPINNPTVSIPFQQPPINVSQPSFAPGDVNETHMTVHLPTTTAPTMSLNHTPAVQIQTPPSTAQIVGNIVPSTSAVIRQQPGQQTTVPNQIGSFGAHVLPPQPTTRMPTFTMPVNHILPNLSAWTFPNPAVTTAPIPTTILPPTQPTAPTFMPFPHTPTRPASTVPITAGGTVYYVPPATVTTPIVYSTVAQPTTSLSPTAATFVPAGTSTTMQPSTTGFTIQDLALLLASTKKDHLPEWKLAQYDGDPIQWYEWFGQFKSAIDSAPLTDDVKLTYLKTLVTGKAKTAIAEFAYCGAMYRDALKTLERKFGQPQAVVTAYLEKLANFPPVKMHNSESIISYSATICSLVGVFRSLNYVQDLSSASLLGQAVQKLPPNLKEGWSMHTVKRDLNRPTLIDFNDWLKDKAEAHERMKAATRKPKVEETPTGNVTKTKTNSKVFAATTTSTKNTIATKPSTQKFQVNCVVCKDKHPLWRCLVFRKKTPTERAKVVAENKLCFSCFNGQHSFRNCPQPRKCTKDGCGSTHNTLLHGAEKIFPRKSESEKAGNGEATTCSVTTATQRKNEKNEVTSCLPSVSDVKGLLQITEVELQTSEKSDKVLVLCDSACSHSWISSELARKLDVHGTPTKLTVHGINSNKVVDTQMVELKLTPVHSGGSCSSFTVKPYVRDQLTIGNDVIDVDDLKTRYPHLEPIALSKYSYKDVKMILGQDAFHAIRPLEYFESDRRNTPVAVRLPLGWVLSGPLPSTTGLFSTCFKAVTQQEHDCTLSDRLRSWYDIESYGAYKQVDSRSATDARATKILDETTYHDGSRYQVGKLWADDESCLPNNYFSALIQLKSLERRLQKDGDLKASYTKTINDDFSKGYIVQVDKTDCFKVDQPREWYLPHHPVVHPHKPGKVRRVLNGAAKFHGQSLNSALLAGPDLLQSLIHILFRFRQYPFAVSADIEGMFLQVGVIPRDRPSLRFLWREHPAAEVAVFEYVRHIFGSKDSPTCANYALKRTATDNQANFPDAARSVHNNFYMDDYLESSPTAIEASNKAKDLVKMLALGGFKLTKFVSNVPSIPIEVDPNSDTRTTEEKEIPTAEKFSHVLGMKWNHSTDTLVVSRGTSPNTDRKVTQRVVLSLVSAVYDPIGLVAPFTIKARLLLKDIWRLSGQQWDDNLPDDIVTKFLEWSKELSSLNEITIPRSYFCQTVETIELHVFGDSSQDAFGAVAFLRGKLVNDHDVVTQLAFVFGKARVAPMKALTVPKLELQAALLAARLRAEVLRALSLKIDRTFMWSDSSTVLQWLTSLEKQPTFVANRVCEILELTTVDEWHYVPTAHNPADAGTRGMSATDLLNSCWLTGPDFLKTSDFPFKLPEEFDQKVKLNKGADSNKVIETKEHQCTTITATVTEIATTFKWQKYSSYEKLLRIVAYMLRLLPKNESKRTDTGFITDPTELDNAQQRLFHLVQLESFNTERKCLLKSLPLSKSSKIVEFSPFIGPNGLLRASGRTKQLDVASFDMKHPILLDSRHPAVRLYLEQLHETHCHQGVDYLRALVQQQFAIVKLRTALRSIVSKCVTCRKRRAETINPIMSDLPRERLAFKARPFTNTGIDYFGPFYVAVKRSTEKRWGFLFTCLTTRAVHFEVVPSMDTSSCVMGIERFAARRGVPSVLWSDNGTNFIASEKELLQNVSAWNQQILSEALVKKQIHWKFNPPSAPHHGGVWERIVRSFKHVFYAILGNRRLTDEILTTTFCLVEQSLNSRPLVPVSSDATDLDALTPNHFLLGTASSTLPSHERADVDHRKRYARAQAYSDAIWDRWLKDYVPSLNRRTKWSAQSDRDLKTGDLVWIVEPTSPRGHYPLARVVKLNYGPDSVARSAELKTTTGNLVRPIVKLAPVLPPSVSPDCQ